MHQLQMISVEWRAGARTPFVGMANKDLGKHEK